MKLFKSVLGLTAVLLASTQAQSAVIATLAFTDPTGVVFSNESFDVKVRLTLDALSDPLTTDSNGYPSNFDPLSYFGPIDLSDPNTNVFLNVYYSCGGTFDNCGAAQPYDFNFNYSAPNFISPTDFTLLPGESYEWVLVSFTPVGGNAPAGSYSLYDLGVNINLYNPGDPFDPADDMYDSISFVSTCDDGNSRCAFTRTVLAAPGAAVPEPASWAMMIGGLGLAGAAMRRRKVAVRLA